MRKKPAIKGAPSSSPAPELVRRKMHQKSTFRAGRTIAEEREKLETASERANNRRLEERSKRLRIISISLGFLGGAVILVLLFLAFTSDNSSDLYRGVVAVPYAPTIEVIDEDSSATGGTLTSRMSEYIGMLEVDLRALGYTPTKAVIPTGTVREVDLYLDGYTGFIKALTDRGSGVTAEDTDRMIRYLAERGITDFSYIDVRIEGKAYWK